MKQVIEEAINHIINRFTADKIDLKSALLEAYQLGQVQPVKCKHTVEEAAKKCIDALDNVNQYEAFIYGAQWQLGQAQPGWVDVREIEDRVSDYLDSANTEYESGFQKGIFTALKIISEYPSTPPNK